MKTASALLAVLAIAMVLATGAPGLLPSAQAAVFEPRDFQSRADEVRYKSLIDELRCPKCQNQNIADSDAPLSQDLRREVFRMIEEGRTDAEILDYMVTRYGDFVLYRPPVKGVTLALWVGPAVLVLAGVMLLWRTLRRRAAEPPAELSDEERARLKTMLGPDGGD